MNFSDFTPREKQIVLDCFRAVLAGRFTWSQEIQTVIGLTSEELRAVEERWPNLDKNNLNDALAVNNCLNQALNDIPQHHWKKWIGVSREEVQSLLAKWRSRPFNPSGAQPATPNP